MIFKTPKFNLSGFPHRWFPLLWVGIWQDNSVPSPSLHKWWTVGHFSSERQQEMTRLYATSIEKWFKITSDVAIVKLTVTTAAVPLFLECSSIIYFSSPSHTANGIKWNLGRRILHGLIPCFLIHIHFSRFGSRINR